MTQTMTDAKYAEAVRLRDVFLRDQQVLDGLSKMLETQHLMLANVTHSEATRSARTKLREAQDAIHTARFELEDQIQAQLRVIKEAMA